MEWISWLPQMLWEDLVNMQPEGIGASVFFAVVLGGAIRLLWRAAPREKRRLWRGMGRRAVRKTAHYPLGLVQNFCANFFRGGVL